MFANSKGHYWRSFADASPLPEPQAEGSTKMDDKTVEKLLDASPAFRVTEAHENSVITSAAYHRLTSVLTVCVLTLNNGFTVTGESACVSAENYNQELGEHYAYVDAKRKVGAFEAYAYRDREYRGQDAPQSGTEPDTLVGNGCASGPSTDDGYMRTRALELALFGEHGYDPDTVVARARTFYEYIASGTLK